MLNLHSKYYKNSGTSGFMSYHGGFSIVVSQVDKERMTAIFQTHYLPCQRGHKDMLYHWNSRGPLFYQESIPHWLFLILDKTCPSWILLSSLTNWRVSSNSRTRHRPSCCFPLRSSYSNGHLVLRFSGAWPVYLVTQSPIHIDTTINKRLWTS